MQRNEIEDGLSVLGRSPVTLRHIFTTVNVSKKNAVNIDAMREFPFVQHMDISENKITILTPLENLPNLLTLNAASNELTEVLDYKVPICEKGSAWDKGDGWIGSTLIKADLSQNRIMRMRDISHHMYLRKLVLDHNEISSIEGIASLKHLEYLSMAHNQLENIQGLANLNIQELVLHHNKISNITSLATMPQLTKLDLSSNCISKLKKFSNCRVLQELFLDDNPISVEPELTHLAPALLLTVLTLRNTPLTKKRHYRAGVLVRLNRLTSLDGTIASAKERVKASCLFGRDIQRREENFRKHLPDEKFFNLVPPIVLDNLKEKPVLKKNTVSTTALFVVHRCIESGNAKMLSNKVVDDVLESMRSRRKTLFSTKT